MLLFGDGYVRKFTYAHKRSDHVFSVDYHAHPTTGVSGYLARNIENFLIAEELPDPIERTYLVTGILEAVMISRNHGSEPIKTPHFESIHYKLGDHVLKPKNVRALGTSVSEWITAHASRPVDSDRSKRNHPWDTADKRSQVNRNERP